MSNAPVAVEVQLPAIIELIEPAGMVIVKVPVLPFMVPLTMIALPPEPGRCIVPEKVDPFWVTCQVVLPAVVPDIPDPIIEPLESAAVPAQLPVMVVVEVGLETAVDCEPHATAAPPLTSVKRTNTHRFITPPTIPTPS
jgi:hypothetical protein